jgi:hypothetical protein
MLKRAMAWHKKHWQAVACQCPKKSLVHMLDALKHNIYRAWIAIS